MSIRKFVRDFLLEDYHTKDLSTFEGSIRYKVKDWDHFMEINNLFKNSEIELLNQVAPNHQFYAEVWLLDPRDESGFKEAIRVLYSANATGLMFGPRTHSLPSQER